MKLASFVTPTRASFGVVDGAWRSWQSAQRAAWPGGALSASARWQVAQAGAGVDGACAACG